MWLMICLLCCQADQNRSSPPCLHEGHARMGGAQLPCVCVCAPRGALHQSLSICDPVVLVSNKERVWDDGMCGYPTEFLMRHCFDVCAQVGYQQQDNIVMAGSAHSLPGCRGFGDHPRIGFRRNDSDWSAWCWAISNIPG